MSAVIKNRKLKKENIKNSHTKLNQRVRRSALRKASVRQRDVIRVYSKLRKKYLEIHPLCECDLPGCTRKAVEIHHKKGRGKNTTDVSTFLAVCRSCHDWIHNNPKEAKELKFLE